FLARSAVADHDARPVRVAVVRALAIATPVAAGRVAVPAAVTRGLRTAVGSDDVDQGGSTFETGVAVSVEPVAARQNGAHEHLQREQLAAWQAATVDDHARVSIGSV